jgi:CRISPR/Cas system-associated endonuclease Cas1
MSDIQQNTLYLLTPGSYVSRDHLTLQVEVPVYPAGLPAEQRNREAVTDTRKLSIPIHHLESICLFGPSAVSPPALHLCWEHGVAVNFLSEHGQFQARMTGVADTSVTLRRTQFRAADDPAKCAAIARQIIAGKIQNSRHSLQRAARETPDAGDQDRLQRVIDALGSQVQHLAHHRPSEAVKNPAEALECGSAATASANARTGGEASREKAAAPAPTLPGERLPPNVETPGAVDRFCEAEVSSQNAHPKVCAGPVSPDPLATAQASHSQLDALRGAEGMAAQLYFSVFSLMLKQQREEFRFTTRSRHPARDRVNCLLSFLYALLRHDCVAALTSAGLDPFVGFLHADRPNRPSLALDLMEEFRPWVADRLAVTLINRQQIASEHFVERQGGVVEFTEAGRRVVIHTYQERKQDELAHPLLEQNLRLAQMPFVQARILARHLRGDLPHYVPLVPK